MVIYFESEEIFCQEMNLIQLLVKLFNMYMFMLMLMLKAEPVYASIMY